MMSLSSTRQSLCAAACAAALWSGSGVAFAQSGPSGRPYRGLFGQRGANLEQSLAVAGSLSGGYDDVLGVTDTVDTPQPAGAGFGQLSASLAYALQRGAIQLSTSVNSSTRYYSAVAGYLVSAHEGSLSLGYQLSRSTELTAGASLAYQPLLALAVFPTISEGNASSQGLVDMRARAGLDAGIRRDAFVTSSTSIGVSQRVSRRGSVNAGYGFRSSRIGNDDSLSSQTGNAGYSYGLSRALSLHLGYGLSRARYPDEALSREFRNHLVDAGIDFQRSIGRTRRTSVSFSTGATVVEQSETPKQYLAIGNAQLLREIGRTWSASAGYIRNVQYVETFRSPVFADALALAVSGELNRRAHFHLQLNAAVGSLTSSGDDSSFTNYSATTGLALAVSRNVSLGVDYMLYRYDFRAAESVPPGLPPQMTRHGVMTSLSVWLPIVETARRSNASR